MASQNEERRQREERRRRHAYEVRQGVHTTRRARRVRDNWIAVGASVAVVAAAVVLHVVVGSSSGVEAPEATATASTPEPTSTSGQNSGEVPDIELSEGRSWQGEIVVNDDVSLGIELDGAAAPQGVASFVSLTQSGFYDGLSCPRLTTGGFFVLQCGSPDGTLSGTPGYSYGPIENAPSDDVYPAGTIAMARVADDGYSMGSQFFIVYEDTTISSDSAGGYTVLGHVTSGLDELRSTITDEGVEGDATDGAPAVETIMTSVTVE
ncbi:peptidylprolyl isomerase [Mycetocola reblochoni]|uniref:peptidylprolyl isomerase n=2 Tax=Mycetocola reblochoni TaxID=331618 RepID=A0A1R4J3I5_9MICO|nr:peptidylprolyl isomerase [Mycetocola reblochoni]RLP69498.1 peptidylprolyl isomerase [Mycetocola reblochoni]SJN26589.1 Peptidyl-prolyl cis-trans isomerase [Mycetocola reblochoni REB411]